MIPVTLSYQDSGVSYSQNFQAYSLKGFFNPDAFQLVNYIHLGRDGTVSGQTFGFKRLIEIDHGPINDNDLRLFILNWLKSDFRMMSSLGLTGYVEPQNPKEFRDEWINGSRFGRRFLLPLIDSNVYQLFPDVTPTSTDLMYCKLDIEMDQDATEASPEVFTTGEGKLPLMETGEAWPVFNALTHTFFVLFKSAKGSSADYPTGSVSIVAGKLVISTFPASGYVPSVDGKLHANFAIWLQPLP
jgi:hypothetical protein